MSNIYESSSLDKFKQLMAEDAKHAEQRQELANAYSQALLKDSNIPLSDDYEYRDVVANKLNEFSQTSQYMDSGTVSRFIQSDPLLDQYFSIHPEELNNSIQSVLKRNSELREYGQTSYDPRLGDVSPVAQVEKPDIIGEEEGFTDAFMGVVKDAGLSLDSLLYRATGKSVSDRTAINAEKVKLMEAQSNLGSEVRTGMAKLQQMSTIENQIRQLTPKANNFTPDGIESQRQLQLLTSKLTSLRNSLSDAEKIAIQTKGKEFTDINSKLNAYQSLSGLLDQRTLYQYQEELDDATHEAQMMSKYGADRSVFNPGYMADSLMHQFSKVMTNPGKYLGELAPYMAIGALENLTGPVGKSISLAIQGLLTAGSASKGMNESIDEYFNKYGSLEGFSKTQAVIGNAFSYMLDLYGSKLLSVNIPKNVVGAFKKDMKREFNETLDRLNSRVSSDVLNTMGSSVAKAEMGVLTKMFSLGSVVEKFGKWMDIAGTKLSTNAVNALTGKPESIVNKALNIVGKSVSKVGSVLSTPGVKHGLNAVSRTLGEGAVDMAFENASAELASQWANQTGIDTDKVVQSALSGIPVGMLGAGTGVGVGVAIQGAKAGIDKYTGANKYKIDKDEIKRETEAIDKMDDDKASAYMADRYTSIKSEEKDIDADIEKLQNSLDKIEDKESRKALRLQKKINALNEAKNEHTEYANIIINKLGNDIKTKYKEKFSTKEGANNSEIIQGTLNRLSDLFQATEVNKEDYTKKIQEILEVDEKTAQKYSNTLLDKNADIDSVALTDAQRKAYDIAKKYDLDWDAMSQLSDDQLKDIDENNLSNFKTKVDDKLKDISTELAKPDINESIKKSLEDTKSKLEDLSKSLDSNSLKPKVDKYKASQQITDSDSMSNLLDSERVTNKDTLQDGSKITDDEFKEIQDTYSEFMDTSTSDTDGTIAVDNFKAQVMNDTSKSQEYKNAFSDYVTQMDKNINEHNLKANSLDNKLYGTESEAENAISDKDSLKKNYDYFIKKDDKTGKWYISDSGTTDRLDTSEKSTIHKIAKSVEGGTSLEDTINKLSDKEKEEANKFIDEVLFSDKMKKVISGVKKEVYKGLTKDNFNKLEVKDQSAFIKVAINAYNKDTQAKEEESLKRLEAYNKSHSDSIFKREESHRMSGYDKSKEAYRERQIIRSFTKEYNNRRESIREFHREVGLLGLDKMSYSAKKPILQKSIIESLDNLGLFNLINELKTLDIDANPTIYLNAINKWIKKNGITEHRLNQLRLIRKYLVQLNQKYEYNNGKWAIATLDKTIQNVIYAIDEGVNIHKISLDANDKVGFFNEASTEYWSTDANKHSMNDLDIFNKACSKAYNGQNESTTSEPGQFSQHLGDSFIDDYLGINVDRNLLNPASVTTWNRYLHTGYNDFYNNLYKSLTTNANNKVVTSFLENACNILLMTTVKSGDKPSKESILKSYKEIAPDGVKKILSRLEAYTNSTELQRAINALDNNSKNVLMNFLIKQKEMLVAMGVIEFKDGSSLSSVTPVNFNDKFAISNLELPGKGNSKNTAKYLQNVILGLFFEGKRITSQKSYLIALSQLASDLHKLGLLDAVPQNDMIMDGVIKAFNHSLARDITFPITHKGKARRVNLRAFLSSNKAVRDMLDALQINLNTEHLPINSIRTYINSLETSGSITKEQAEVLRQNIGKILIYHTLSKMGSINKKDANTKIENIMTLGDVFRHYDTIIPKYTSHTHLPEDLINTEDFSKYVDIVLANLSNSKDIRDELETIAQGIITNSVDKDLWNRYKDNLFASDGSLNAYNDILLNLTDSNSSRVIGLFAKVLGTFINNYQLANTIGTTDQSTSFTDFSTSKGESNRIANNHTHNSYLTTEDLKRKPPKTQLAYTNALQRIREANSGSIIADQVNSVIKFIEHLSYLGDQNLVVDSLHSNHLASRCESTNGRYNEEYLNVVASVALRGLVSFSTELSDDYAQVLQSRYSDVPSILEFFRTNKCMDIETIAEDMGKAIYSAMGYSKDSALASALIQDFGKHAVALLHFGGYIKVQKMDKLTGQLRDAKPGERLEGTITVVTLTQPGEHNREIMSLKDKYVSNTGTTRSIVSDILKLDSPIKYPRTGAEYKERQTKYESEFDDSNAVQIGETKPEIINKENHEYQIHYDSENNILRLTDTVNGTPTYTYFSGSLLRKKDNTNVTPYRLLQIMRNMKEPVYVNVKAVQSSFGVMFKNGDLLPEFTNEYNYNTPELLDKLVEKYPILKVLIKYENPTKYQGVYNEYVVNKNFQAMRSLVESARFLKNSKIIDSTEERIALYYDELNTVNNRFFVENQVFNYRENKNLRNLFYMSKTTRQYTVSDKREIVDDSNANVLDDDLIAPILAGLDTKWDKLKPEKRYKLWHKIANSDEFVNVIKAFRKDSNNNYNFTDINKAVDAFNTKFKEDEDLHYSIQQGGKDLDKKVSIDVNNPETFWTLSKLANVSIEFTAGYLLDSGFGASVSSYNVKRDKRYTVDFNKESDDLHIKAGLLVLGNKNLVEPDSSIKVSNYDIRIEVDGINNGGALKALASNLSSTGDPYQLILAEASGISLMFFDYVDAIESGLLDNYLLAGSNTQKNLIKQNIDNIIRNNFGKSYSNASIQAIRAIFAKTELEDTEIGEAIAGILTRDLMKPPVMHIGYEAGLKSEVLNLLKIFSKQFSTQLASGNTDLIKQSLKALIKANSNNPLRIMFRGEYTYLWEDGTVGTTYSMNNPNIFSNNEYRMGINVDFTLNNGLAESLKSDFLETLYKSSFEVIKPARELLEMQNEATMAHAYAYNEALMYLLDKEFKDGEEMSTIEAWRRVDNIINELLNIFTPIIGFDDAGDLSGYQLSTFKDAIKKDVQFYFCKARTLVAGDKVIISNKYKGVAKDSLGSGLSPMDIHSMDSFIMTNFQDYLIRNGFGKGLPIHDAIIANLEQLGALPTLNEICRVARLQMAKQAVDRDNSMRVAISWLRSSDFPSELREKLITNYNRTYNTTSSHTAVNILYGSKVAIEQAISAVDPKSKLTSEQKEQARQLYINQYFYGADSVYVPDYNSLKDELTFINGLITSSNSNEILIDNAVFAIEAWARNQTDRAIRDAVLDKKMHLRKDLISYSDSIESLCNKVFNKIYSIDSNFDKKNFISDIRSRINNDIINQDSYIQTVMSFLPEGTALEKANAQEIITNRANNVLKDPTQRDVTNVCQTIYDLVRVHVTQDYTGGINNSSTGIVNNNLEILRYTRMAILKNRGIFKPGMSKLDILSIVSDAVSIALGNSLNQYDLDSFHKISRSLKLEESIASYKTIDQLDTSKNTILEYNDDLSYSTVEQEVEKEFNRLALEFPNQKKTREQLLNDWFLKNVLSDLTQYKDMKVQVVFTLRSKLDVLKLQALSQLKAIDGYKDIDIFVLPAITDINSHAPEVDKEVEVYRRILSKFSNNKSKLGVRYIRTTTGYTNDKLLEVITQHRIDKATILDKLQSVDADVPMVSSNRDTTYEKRSAYKPAILNVTYKDEYGETRKYSYDQQLPPEIVLEKSGIRNRSVKEIEFTNLSLDSLELDQYLAQNQNDFYESNINDTELSFTDESELEEALISGNKIIGINISSDGLPIANKVDILRYKLPTINKAITAMQADMRADYEKYLRGVLSWESYIKPRMVAIEENGIKYHFVFNVTKDTSVTKAELSTALGEDERGRPIVVQGTPLSSWLKTNLERDPKLRKFILSHKGSNSVDSTRVFIPREFIDIDSLKYTTEDPILANYNAVAMHQIGNYLKKLGITTDILFLHQRRNDAMNKREIIPTSLNYSMVSLENINKLTVDTFSSIVNNQRNTRIEKIKNAITAPFNAVSTLFSGSNKTQYRDSNDTTVTHYMTGYDANSVVREQLDGIINQGLNFVETIRACKERDMNNGVDTNDSEFSWFDSLMEETTTPIVVYMDSKSNTVKTSRVSLVRDASLGVSRYQEMVLGMSNKGESQTEAIRHEYAHTVWDNMLPEDRAEMTKIYNLWLKHHSMSDFIDGDTKTNRMIVDAITNEKTPDPVAEFATYATTNKKFRDSIRNMESKLNNKKLKESFITKVSNIFKGMIDKIVNFIRGNYKPKSNQERNRIINTIDNLFKASYKASAKYWQESANINEMVETKNSNLKLNAMDSTKGNYIARGIIENTQSDFVTKARDILAKGLVLGGEATVRERLTTGSFDASQALIGLANDFVTNRDTSLGKFITDILGTMEGASPDMYKYLQIRNQGKILIDQNRERSASAVNSLVKEILKDVPSELEEQLTNYLIRTDISCLYNSTRSPEEIKELLTNKETRDKEISRLETSIRSKGAFSNFYINASKGLAKYLITGFNPTGLAYRNAYEIASRAGSNNQVYVDYNGPLVNEIDQLVTLYAINELPSTEIYEKLDSNVITQMSILHKGIKETEFETVYGKSHQKYHIPKGQLHGGKVTGRYDIVPQEQLKALIHNGYEKVDDAKLDPFYKGIAGNNKYVIVQAKHKSPTPYTAGVTAMTDIFMGRNKSGLSWNGEGEVDKEIDFRRTNEFAKLQQYINTRINALNKPNPSLLQDETHGNLVPNFNFLGKLNGSNFELNPITTDVMIGRNRKITSVLGDLYGSVVERSQSPEYNKKAGEAMIEIYENAKKPSQAHDFVWISENSEKEEYRDFYDKLPIDTKEVCIAKYKDKGIPVMKKALTTVFGYTNISANDKDAIIEAQKAVDKIGYSFSDYIKYCFHSKYVGNLEELFSWLADVGKDNLVIKGLSVSWNNLISNCTTLLMNGLSLKDVAKYQAEAFTAFKSLNDMQKQLQDIKTKKLNNTYTDMDAKAERALRVSIEKSPLYPLISKGILANSLAEDNTESDRFLKDTIDQLIPKGILRDIAQTVALTPKSKIYQAMSLFASAGDTVAKYALFKDMREKGFSEEEASRIALQTFIDYSNPLPKQLAYLDSIGVLPFAKYTLASQSSILNTLVKRPDRALGFILANSMFLGLPNIFEGIFTPDVLAYKANLPGGMFLDSIKQLPSVRITNTISELI